MSTTWLPAPRTFAPTPDAIHIWRLALADAAPHAPTLSAFLSADERARAARFHFARDRERFTLSHGWLRAVLARYSASAPAGLTFSVNAYGKPDLPGPWRFNLSHSHEYAALAVTWERAIGVDIEYARPLDDFADLAAHVFAPAEQADLAALPPAAQHAAFFRCWARKEAYIKAIGLGLSCPLDSFTVSLAPDEPARLLSVADDPHAPTRWTLRTLDIAPQYAAAALVAGAPTTWHHWDWLP